MEDGGRHLLAAGEAEVGPDANDQPDCDFNVQPVVTPIT